MNSESEEFFSTTIKKAKPKQIRTTQKNVITISKPTLSSTTLEIKTTLSKPNITPSFIDKEITNTEEKSKNSLFYIVFVLFVVSVLIIFGLLFVVHLNRRKRYKRIIKFV
jgi:hypothetical protein